MELEKHVAQSGQLLQRCRGIIGALQNDVGGLLWEIDTRVGGTSFHADVARHLPVILAAAGGGSRDSAVAGGKDAAAVGAAMISSPEEAACRLLQSAQDRVDLLHRAYGVVSSLQTDVDACLWELGQVESPPAAGGGDISCSCVPSPIPFPALGPHEGLQQHTTHTFPSGGAARADSEPGVPASLSSSTTQGCRHNDTLEPIALGTPLAKTLAGPSEPEPPASSSPQLSPLPFHTGATLSPSTAAFVRAACTARETEAAEHAAQPRAVLDTSLKDASLETERWVA